MSGESPASDRTRLTRQLRRTSEHIVHRVHGPAVIRDQKPMSEAKLRQSLTDMSVEDWLERLNSFVFFAATSARLESLYATYRGSPRLLLTIDTARLVEQNAGRVRLSHINSGAVRYATATRGSSTFQTIGGFDHKGAGWVAEIAVKDRVPITPGLVLDASVWHPDGSVGQLPLP